MCVCDVNPDCPNVIGPQGCFSSFYTSVWPWPIEQWPMTTCVTCSSYQSKDCLQIKLEARPYSSSDLTKSEIWKTCTENVGLNKKSALDNNPRFSAALFEVSVPCKSIQARWTSARRNNPSWKIRLNSRLDSQLPTVADIIHGQLELDLGPFKDITSLSWYFYGYRFSIGLAWRGPYRSLTKLVFPSSQPVFMVLAYSLYCYCVGRSITINVCMSHDWVQRHCLLWPWAPPSCVVFCNQ